MPNELTEGGVRRTTDFAILHIPRFRFLFQGGEPGLQFQHFKQLAIALGKIYQDPGLGRGDPSLVKICDNSRKEFWNIGYGADIRYADLDRSVLFRGNEAIKASRAVGLPRSATCNAEECLPQVTASL
jgi:hypothetical protein